MKIDLFGRSSSGARPDASAAPRALSRGARFGLGALALAVVAVGAFRLGAAVAADRQSGIQTSPDTDYVIISKDINGDRWAITLNVIDGTIVGNVFPQSGGAPQFVQCAWVPEDDTDTEYAFDCSVASACTGAPCDGTNWTDVGEVKLAKTFVTPPGEAEPLS